MVSHRRPTQSGPGLGARVGAVTAVSAAAATAAATLGASPAGAEPQRRPEVTRATVDRLFADAEKATERYHRADERARKLRGLVDQAQDRAARGQEAVNKMRGALGSLALAQYRSGGMDPALALLLSSDPDGYLDRAAVLERVGVRQSAALSELQQAQRTLGRVRSEAARDLTELERSRAAVARHKRAVEGKLAEARRVLATLPGTDRDAYGRSSRSDRDARGGQFLGGPGGAASSARAAAAVRAARNAVGRPYVWGANGPSGFDCSGLTQWSYAQAGVGLPRTSQAQRYAGRQVPLSQALPGDLVAYRADASHIAMYVGNGQVIHAPYPGAPVRYDPVGMMPVSSVTRI
ncbi:C40 family peptidase [Streptomyces corynorhini]|uniref:NlpC/P60 family protein n=1 Tax=Streptomyces corynorhini TaxID=2282652 RepID=A0A370BFD0_9ACTN|nr:C40 family peptidase [Streptomyces corynorhini]RDG38145.1 NlpC/P60 family protein [Streptomyces corynorhini]